MQYSVGIMSLVAVVRCGSEWSAGRVVGEGVRGSVNQQRCERGYPTLSPSPLPPNVSTSTCQVQFSARRRLNHDACGGAVRSRGFRFRRLLRLQGKSIIAYDFLILQKLSYKRKPLQLLCLDC